MIWHGNCLSPGSVAVEFEGNFPNIKGGWWINKEAKVPDKDKPTQAQLESGKFLTSYLKTVLNTTHILAHRQGSDSRENDPGPDVWYNVGQWAIDKLGLTDGGATFQMWNRQGDFTGMADLGNQNKPISYKRVLMRVPMITNVSSASKKRRLRKCFTKNLNRK